MNILGIIPARGGSKRLKDKNIIPLLGKPLISYAIRHAKKSKLLNRVVCSTNSNKIAKVAKKYSCEVIKRPGYLAGDKSMLDDALIHAINYLDKKCSYRADIVVVILANIPVRKPGVIDEAIRKLIKTKADSVFSVEDVGKYHPYWMVKKGKGDRMFYYKASSVFRKQDLPFLYINNGAVWAVWADILRKTVKRKTNYSQFGKDIRLIVQKRYDVIDVDDIYDLHLAEAVLKKR